MEEFSAGCTADAGRVTYAETLEIISTAGIYDGAAISLMKWRNAARRILIRKE